MSELIDRLVDFVKKLSGIKWFAVVDKKENRIVEKSPIISDEAVDRLIAISNISSELSREVTKYTVTASGEVGARSIYVRLNNEGLEIEDLGEHVLLLNTDHILLEHLYSILDRVRRGDKVECKVCGRDLLLETYECPRCGRTIPFVLNRCPYCNYRLPIKKCPGHNGFVDVHGNPVKRDYAILGLGVGIGVSIVAMTVYMGLLLPEYSMFLYSIGGVISLLMAVFGLYASSPR